MAQNSRSPYIFLLSVAALIVIVGLLFNPSFIAKYLSSDGILEKTTVIEVYILEAFAIAIGFVVCLYSLLKILRHSSAEKLPKIAFAFVTAFPMSIAFLYFLYCAFRAAHSMPIDYNEGWNVIHTARFFEKGVLYSPVNGLPVTPVNYPPLSFIIIGALSHYTTLPLLQVGRLVSLISPLLIFYFIFGIIVNFTSKISVALLGALLWITLIVGQAKDFIAMYDPQLLAHVFSLGSLYFYSNWRDKLTLQRTFALALLCCLGFFIKHLLIAVPVSLAIALLFTNKKHFIVFFLSEVILFSLIFYAIFLYWGEYFFSNFIDFSRPYSSDKAAHTITNLFIDNWFSVVFLMFTILLFKFKKEHVFAIIYFVISFLIGAYVIGGLGVGRNAWFDFFIASAIVFGLLAAEAPRSESFFTRIALCGVLSFCFLPFFFHYQSLMDEIINYNSLKDQEKSYQKSVETLQSITGPVLFEDLLLGFDARKEFLFDPFSGSLLIVAGRINERVLTNPIHEGYFRAIVLTTDLEKVLSKLNDYNMYSGPKISKHARWTENTLKAINDHYELLETASNDAYRIYLPRK